MKNNKGFSLVELIIVIAIMAILVGVIAPQLIKYIEKSRQASDVQLCDTVKTAIVTATSDPAVVTANESCPSAFAGTSGAAVSTTVSGASAHWKNAFSSILGTTDPGTMLKSTLAKGKTMNCKIVNDTQVTVWVAGASGVGAGVDTQTIGVLPD